jgi:DMSO/TMAO reductase YedYZ heme-binding membrane subunit
MVMAFIVSWQGWRSGDRAWAAIQLGVFLALIGIVVHGLFDVPYFKNDLSLEFWALLGLSYAGVRWADVGASASDSLIVSARR